MTSQQPGAAWTPPPEEPGPAPGFEFAPHGARLVAYIIDVFIVGFVISIVAIVAGIAAFPSMADFDPDNPVISPALAGFISLLVIVSLGLSLAYFPWFWSRGGQTPGMRPFGLYVVGDRDGGPITLSTAFLRLVGYWVSSAVFSLGFIWVLIDKRRRGWHDLIAGTVVVRRLA